MKKQTSKDAIRRRAAAELLLCTCASCIEAMPERGALLKRKKSSTKKRVDTRNAGKL